MRSSSRWTLLSLFVLGCAGLMWSFAPAPLAAPVPWTAELPPAAPPASMALYQLPTGTYNGNAGIALRGGSLLDKRAFAATALLVHHPKGDLLFDAGFSAHVETQPLPWFADVPTDRREDVRTQLEAAGYDFGALRGVVITHAHWDHVSGLADLSVPVWMNAAEQRYVSEDRADTRVFRSLGKLDIKRYDFPGPAYLGFSASYDVWGDGSVVLVPAPGHTPGSIVAFISLPSGDRYALIGDIAWQLDAIDKRAERPWLMRLAADFDPTEERDTLLRVIALAGRMHIVPAHDGRAFASIPRLPEQLSAASDSRP